MSAAFHVTNFRAIQAGALVGFADVALPSGMILHRCSIFAKDDRAWASPPSKPIIGRDGTAQRTSDAKVRYEPTVSFTDRWTAERWSTAVVEALRAEHPDVFE
jgi:hypothetical protein